MLILDLDEGDTGGDTVSRVTHDGHEAILEEVMGPGLIAVKAWVDMVCVSVFGTNFYICTGFTTGFTTIPVQM